VTAPPIANGTVACEDGVIRYVGSRDAAPTGDDYDLGDALLLPGLVNAHTHLELTAMRGFLEGLSFSDWIDTLRRSRNDVLTEASMLDAARLGIVEGLERGITTYADTCSSGVAMRAMRELGVRGIMYQETFGPHPDVCDAAMAELRRRVELLRGEETALVKVGISPHAPYTVSDALYTAAVSYANAEGLPVAMHIAESIDEQRFVCIGEGDFADRARARDIPVHPRGRSPIGLLDTLGCLGDQTLLIHTVQLDHDDIRTIVRQKSAVAHCPASNAKFGHGIAPLTELLAAGVDVGLGSDSVASNNRMDVLDEARLAALFQSARTGDSNAVPAQTALELATIRGARALRLDHEIGSLEPGKSADLAAFDLRAARTIPVHDPVAAAIYAMSGAPALLVAVAGRHLVEESRVAIHPGTLHDRVTAVGDALAAWRVPV
jgi:5-methylthioadenosine/S-adenosylhomocysteine deaminase